MVIAFAKVSGSLPQDNISFTLDLGALVLPYEPQIDVRNSITIEELMRRYQPGPNGAIIMATDLVAGEAKRLNDELAEIDTQYAIFDTPGQMELFAFRASGSFILKELDLQQKAILYLFDAPFCSNPLNYSSNLFLAAAVYNRFTLPQLNLLSKTDLLPKARLISETLVFFFISHSAREAESRGFPEPAVSIINIPSMPFSPQSRLDLLGAVCSSSEFLYQFFHLLYRFVNFCPSLIV